MPDLRESSEAEEWTLEELHGGGAQRGPDGGARRRRRLPLAAEGADEQSLLPSWYMPAPQSFVRSRSRRTVAWVFVGSLLLLNAAGLCVTYGVVEIAW